MTWTINEACQPESSHRCHNEPDPHPLHYRVAKFAGGFSGGVGNIQASFTVFDSLITIFATLAMIICYDRLGHPWWRPPFSEPVGLGLKRLGLK